MIDIYTDGSCSGNPGPGGWAYIVRHHGLEREWEHHDRHLEGLVPGKTTNNRMELTAVIKALKFLSRFSDDKVSINVYTDSRYVIDTMTIWSLLWSDKHYAKLKKLKNADLWLELFRAVEPYDITWNWIKGHSGHRDNDRVDLLAHSTLGLNPSRSLLGVKYKKSLDICAQH